MGRPGVEWARNVLGPHKHGTDPLRVKLSVAKACPALGPVMAHLRSYRDLSGLSRALLDLVRTFQEWHGSCQAQHGPTEPYIGLLGKVGNVTGSSPALFLTFVR